MNIFLYNKIVWTSIVLLLIFGLSLLNLNAVELYQHFTTMIINSSQTVKKYNIVQESYQSYSQSRQITKSLDDESMHLSDLKLALLNNDPDIVYCIGSKSYSLVNKLITNQKIVFSSIINWKRLPLGENTYGIANEVPSMLQLTLYRYLFPELKTIGILYSKKFNDEWLSQTIRDAKEVNIDIKSHAIRNSSELAEALGDILPMVDALWLIADPVVLENEQKVMQIFNLSKQFQKPVFAYDELYAQYGATVIVSADLPTIGVQAATLGEELFNNIEIATRVQNPAGSSITLNLKNVRDYGIKFNRDALDSVNNVID